MSELTDRSDLADWAHVEDVAAFPLGLMGAGNHAITIARRALATRDALDAAEAKLAAIDALPDEQYAPAGRYYHNDHVYIYADEWFDAMKAVSRILHPDEPRSGERSEQDGAS